MKKIISIVLFLGIVSSAVAATKNWTNNSSPVNFNWSRGTGAQDNWSTTGVPTSSDVANLAATSAVRCSCNVNPIICNQLTVNNSYGFRWTWNTGIAFHVVTSFLDNGTSSRILRDSLVLEGNGYLQWNSGLGVVNAAGLSMRFMGIDTVNDNKSIAFARFSVDASKSVRFAGTGTSTFGGTCPIVTLGNSASFFNASILKFNPSNAGQIFSFGTTPTTGGSKMIQFNLTASDTIPAWTYAGTAGTIEISNNGATANGTFNLAGALDIGRIDSLHIEQVGTGAGKALTFNSNNHDITAGDISWGSIGNQNTTLNMGSSNIYCLSYGMQTYTHGGAVETANMGSSVWYDSTHWLEVSAHTNVPGTFAVHFVGGKTSAIDFGSNAMYDIYVEKGTGVLCTTKVQAVDSIHDLILTSGKWMSRNSNVMHSYTNNLSAAGDTAIWRGRKFIGGDFNRGAGSHATVDSPTVFIGATESDITSSGFTLFQMYMRKSHTAVTKLMDNLTCDRFTQDSGIFVQNKKVLTDSIQIWGDSCSLDTTVNIYTKDSLKATAKLSFTGPGRKRWIGSNVLNAWSSGKTRRGIEMIKTGAGGAISNDPLRTPSLTLTDGTFFSGDTVYADTLIDTTADSTTFHVIHLTGTHPYLFFGPNSKPGFTAGAQIISDACYPTIINSSGHSIPSYITPNCHFADATAVSGSASSSGTVGVVISAAAAGQSGSATVSGTLVFPPNSVTGNVFSQSASSTGTITVELSSQGTFFSQPASSIGTVDVDIVMEGNVSSQSATTTGHVQTITPLHATAHDTSQEATGTGIVAVLIEAQGNTISQSASNSGIVQCVIHTSGSCLSASASGTGTIQNIIKVTGACVSGSATCTGTIDNISSGGVAKPRRDYNLGLFIGTF